MPSRQRRKPAQARQAHHAHKPTPSHNARENAHQRRKRDPATAGQLTAGDASQARHSPREAGQDTHPRPAPETVTTPAEAHKPRPAAETIHQRRHAQRAPPAAKDQRPRHAAKLDTTSSTTTPRKRCKTPAEPPTPRPYKDTRHAQEPPRSPTEAATERPTQGRQGEQQESHRRPAPSPISHHARPPTRCQTTPAATSAHQRPPPQAEPAPETAETPTPTTAKL